MATRKSTASTKTTLVIKVADGTCGCGCGAETKPKRSFAQGHDARLHGILARAIKDGMTDVQVNTTPAITMKARYAASKWAWLEPKPAKTEAVKVEAEQAA